MSKIQARIAAIRRDFLHKNGNTLLSIACLEKNEEHVLFWHEKGADFKLENNNGQSGYSLLQNHPYLSPALQSLKEQLILNEMIDHSEYHYASL